MKRLLSALSLLLLLAPGLLAQEIPPGVRCHECGMKVAPESPFSAYAITEGGQKVYFCDIGDMLYHVLKRGKTGLRAMYVRDYEGGTWLSAKEAFFVRNRKAFRSPMGWAIGAFASEAEARRWGSPVGLEGAAGLLE
jgi:nitrous oxide reductase accessory protein NosL